MSETIIQELKDAHGDAWQGQYINLLQRELNEAKEKLETMNAVHDRYFLADNEIRQRLVSLLGTPYGHLSTTALVDLLIAQLAAVTKERNEAKAERDQTHREFDALKVAMDQVTKERDLIRQKLIAPDSDSIVASCDCETKTPEIKYHRKGCRYRLISERDQFKACAEKIEKFGKEFVELVEQHIAEWDEEGCPSAFEENSEALMLETKDAMAELAKLKGDK